MHPLWQVLARIKITGSSTSGGLGRSSWLARHTLTTGQNLDFTIRYAFLDPPTFHPLPRPAPLGRFRHSDPGRALDLLFSGMRKINIPPNRPLTAGRSWLRATVSHFLTASVYLVLYDLLFRSVVVISPDTFGHPSRTGGDFPLFVKELSEGCRLPWFVVWAGLGWVFMAGIMLALHGQYHLTAAISVGVGYNTDEEWPRPMDKPWLADSLNNLWGQRYHQVSHAHTPASVSVLAGYCSERDQIADGPQHLRVSPLTYRSSHRRRV